MPFPVDLAEKLLQLAAKLELKPEDIDEQMIRGSGKGGQKVNKTASCVQLIHRPTGIIIKCQKHREQSKNRLSAYKLLLLKLEMQLHGEESAIAKKIHKLKKQKQKRSKRAQAKVLDQKSKRGEIKENRKRVE